MKFLAKYSITKFAAFSPEQQLRAIDKLIDALEQALDNEEQRSSIIKHINELKPLIAEPLPRKLSLFLGELNPRLSPHQLLNKLYFYHEGALRKDSQLAIKSAPALGAISLELRQKAASISIIGDNLRSVFNVGSLFRIAECLGLKELLLCGITPDPKHPQLAKTAMGTQELVAWQSFDTTLEAIASCRESGCRIYALETCYAAQPVFGKKYSFPLALVVGNESLGIAPEVLGNCDEAIYLPQLGWKSSLNVGVAASIALYQIIFGGEHG